MISHINTIHNIYSSFCKLILAAAILFISSTSVGAYEPWSEGLNDAADNILGNYEGSYRDDAFRVRVTRNSDGSYKAQLYWVKNDRDENGNKFLDKKNPDKKLRNVPCDQIVLFDGIKYNPAKHRWDSSKVYEPRRGIRANAVCTFCEDGRLEIKGSVGPFSESSYWRRIK